ncbi:hypothetical protein [Qipengyuania citrea]|uniref:hypothetical protein n=1 Tax=Qipengyuania citrea TaxID=225971 RepID=UPI00209EF4DC|nr:hypothetical protein [Qipengyuania citrea]MCP2016826.1 hypothetical protein [Qipengyuania citrea]
MTKEPPRKGINSYHITRYLANQGGVPVGHFSVLTEMTFLLIAPLEELGYELPERLWPDISSGSMFARHLREECGIDTDRMPTFVQSFQDGRKPVQPKAYPERLLADFRSYFREVWLPTRAWAYFEEKDPTALPYLKQLLDRLAA